MQMAGGREQSLLKDPKDWQWWQRNRKAGEVDKDWMVGGFSTMVRILDFTQRHWRIFI